eukprot:m.266659 g.266659  ORF g.266659 m.266659 type:complete len:174 (-) comp31183_c0_seq1:26-547(-)
MRPNVKRRHSYKNDSQHNHRNSYQSRTCPGCQQTRQENLMGFNLSSTKPICSACRNSFRDQVHAARGKGLSVWELVTQRAESSASNRQRNLKERIERLLFECGVKEEAVGSKPTPPPLLPPVPRVPETSPELLAPRPKITREMSWEVELRQMLDLAAKTVNPKLLQLNLPLGE